ncbi:MAG: exodeoxyribonuclease VII large subunit [Candidatus Brocadiia bacterium]|nr:MAG: exodeoxyribonuclease VII large subunit [Candidatus Brocadiia bacterium]
MAKEKPTIYSVSQVSQLIKTALEENLPSRLIVSGEISDWKLHYSGHCYFSLKDKDSTLPCVMWKSSFAKTKFEPDNGMAVLATGYIDVYTPQGKFQFYVEKLDPAGIGALQLAFEQTVRRLQAEGLFDEKHKKPLPPYPMRIGIVTSPTGAAIEDIRDSIFNRWPCAELLLWPVPVQGEGAADQIAKAIRDINKKNKKLKLDLLIVGRGGGSMEDLWAFNEEVVARAIFDSVIPIISAVGHEIDTTVADLVADARASTPTKAGVTAVPDIVEVLANLQSIEKRLTAEIKADLNLALQHLRTLLASAVFRNPLLAVNNARQRLDELDTKLVDSLKKSLTQARESLHGTFELITKIEPHRIISQHRLKLTGLENNAKFAIKEILNRLKLLLAAQQNSLRAMNPKSVLKRGYSLTTSKTTGKVVASINDINIGEFLITELADENILESQVKIKQNKPTKDAG